MTRKENQPGLRIERPFDVSPDIVFKTLKDPAEMPIWWGDAESLVIHLTCDAGGSARSRFLMRRLR